MLHSGDFFLLNIDKSNKVVLNKIFKSYAFWVIKDVYGNWQQSLLLLDFIAHGTMKAYTSLVQVNRSDILPPLHPSGQWFAHSCIA